VEVIIHDPYVAEYKGDLYRLAEKADALVLMVAHSDYKNLDLDGLKQMLHHPILVDGRGVFVERYLVDNGWYYHCLGKEADSASL
jgi:UDP-N-acetyl-D-mannosaminuronate dehydrogenase